ncbi:MAG: zinc metallopeptidase [Clostridia bacterium]|nr:zinc metallopeptidase [Clostridia bacterium]
MYLDEYIYFLIGLAVCALFSAYASYKVSSTFRAYSGVRCQSGMTGYDTAKKLLAAADAREIEVGKVSGTLTDHYHPTKGVVNLSESTYGSASVGAVAVAAHEVGHVAQKKKGYFPYRVRTALVPVVNIGSRLALPLVLIGMVLDLFSLTPNASIGFTVAIIGVALYGAATLFQLITLPVEYNASRRAKKMLREQGVLTNEELRGADKVLDAAALTYVAALATSLLYFLRFLLVVLSLFGRRRR